MTDFTHVLIHFHIIMRASTSACEMNNMNERQESTWLAILFMTIYPSDGLEYFATLNQSAYRQIPYHKNCERVRNIFFLIFTLTAFCVC